MCSKCVFRGNKAIAGGAIYAEESTVHISSEITIMSNEASAFGGGLYLYHSNLNCLEGSTFNVLSNRANDSGGGIHATNSFITVYHNRGNQFGSPPLKLI